MKSFIDSNLMPDEKLVYRARIHWIVYLQAVLYAIFAAVVWSFGKFQLNMNSTILNVMGGALLVVSIYRFVMAWIHVTFTEMAITDRRIIAKHGFIQREAVEIPLVKIESVMIYQSVVDRILDSGSVAASGTGSSLAPVRFIDSPLEFRNQLNEAISKAKSGS